MNLSQSQESDPGPSEPAWRPLVLLFPSVSFMLLFYKDGAGPPQPVTQMPLKSGCGLPFQLCLHSVDFSSGSESLDYLFEAPEYLTNMSFVDTLSRDALSHVCQTPQLCPSPQASVPGPAQRFPSAPPPPPRSPCLPLALCAAVSASSHCFFVSLDRLSLHLECKLLESGGFFPWDKQVVFFSALFLHEMTMVGF